MKKIKALSGMFAVILVFSLMLGNGDFYVKAAAKIAISNAEEFLAMENNPNGDYYLTKDISLPENTSIFTGETPFSGSLDGKGYKIKGYTFNGTGYCRAGIIGYAKKATFKNLSLTNININIDSQERTCVVGPLSLRAFECSFLNIKVSGNINVVGNAEQVDYIIGGMCAYATTTTKIEKCKGSVNITADVSNYWNGIDIAGLVAGSQAAKVSKCSYSGKINLKAKVGGEISVTGIIGSAYKIQDCTNTGKVMVDILEPDLKGGRDININGICGKATTVTSCANKGNISVTSSASGNGMNLSGIVGSVEIISGLNYKGPTKISKSYNKGSITYNGKISGMDTLIAGVVASSVNTIECYNKGKVFVKHTGDGTKVGGVCGVSYGMKNCYNVGAVTQKGKGDTGGVAGIASLIGNKLTCCYNVGKVSGPKAAHIGALLGGYEGADVVRKRNVYNNYYKGNVKKPYGRSYITWKEWVAKASKVSSISKGSCPKLSPKKWIYSKKYKRLILKGNKEK